MKILYFHQYFGTPKGAGGTRSYEMATALLAAGHEITMVCASSDRSTTGLSMPFVRRRREGMVGGIRVIEFDLGCSNADSIFARSVKFLAFAFRSIAVALREPCDLVFASSTPLTAGVPGLFARLFRRKPFVFEVRDLWPELPRAMGMRNPLLLAGMSCLERASYAAADRVIGLAPGIVDGIARTGKSRDKISLVPNGCDFALFDAADALPPYMYFPESIAPNDFVAIFAGAHGRANGLEAVLAAAAVLRQRYRDDIKLLLIGQGSEKAKLEEQAKRDALTNVVFADAMAKETLARLIKGADVGLQVLANIPAFYEGTSPNKFFDYLAAARPIIINYPGWLARAVTEYGCGIAISPDDQEAFANALVQLAQDKTAANAMGANALQLGLEKFDRNILTSKMNDIIIDTVKNANN